MNEDTPLRIVYQPIDIFPHRPLQLVRRVRGLAAYVSHLCEDESTSPDVVVVLGVWVFFPVLWPLLPRLMSAHGFMYSAMHPCSGIFVASRVPISRRRRLYFSVRSAYSPWAYFENWVMKGALAVRLAGGSTVIAAHTHASYGLRNVHIRHREQETVRAGDGFPMDLDSRPRRTGLIHGSNRIGSGGQDSIRFQRLRTHGELDPSHQPRRGLLSWLWGRGHLIRELQVAELTQFVLAQHEDLNRPLALFIKAGGGPNEDSIQSMIRLLNLCDESAAIPHSHYSGAKLDLALTRNAKELIRSACSMVWVPTVLAALVETSDVEAGERSRLHFPSAITQVGSVNVRDAPHCTLGEHALLVLTVWFRSSSRMRSQQNEESTEDETAENGAVNICQSLAQTYVVEVAPSLFLWTALSVAVVTLAPTELQPIIAVIVWWVAARLFDYAAALRLACSQPQRHRSRPRPTHREHV